MQKKMLILAVLTTGISLIGCASSNSMQSGNRMAQSNAIKSSMPVSEQTNSVLSMDTVDKDKMFKAFDKGIGKTTEWTNEMTGAQYSVVPIKKVTINGNPYCRKYKVKIVKHDAVSENMGTACVSVADGSWQIVS